MFQRMADAINKMILPAGDDVGRVQRDGVELVLPVDAKLVAGLFGVMLVAVDAEVFDEKAVLQREIRVPHLEFSVIYDSRGLLVGEWNLAFRQKISNLPLNAGFVFRPAAYLMVMIIVHPSGRGMKYLNVSVCRISRPMGL